MTDAYIRYVQPRIDAIVSLGDIRNLVGQIATLFNGVQSTYIGTDGNPHTIVYEPFTVLGTSYGNGSCNLRAGLTDIIEAEGLAGLGGLEAIEDLELGDRRLLERLTQLGLTGNRGNLRNGIGSRLRTNERGFLPVGTEQTATSTVDCSQIPYSMLPLINYVRSYNRLALHTTSGRLTDCESSAIRRSGLNALPVQYDLYDAFIKSYDALKVYFDQFVGTPKTYDVPLYRYVTDPDLLQELLNEIYRILFRNLRLIREMILFRRLYERTIYYEVGMSNVGVGLLSRTVALNMRREQGVRRRRF